MKSNASSNKLEDLRNQNDNRKCFDCHEKGTTYVVLDYGIFVCSACSGIHREMTHKVKGIGMSNFSDKEIEMLVNNGNQKQREILMGEWSAKLYPEPDKRDIVKMKEFFKLKYQQKRFLKKEQESDSDESEEDNKKKVPKKATKQKQKKPKKQSSSSDEDAEESEEEEKRKKIKKAKEEKKIEEPQQQKSNGLKFPAAPGSKKTHSQTHVVESNLSSNNKNIEQKSQQNAGDLVDLLEIGSEQPKRAQENNEQWSNWASFGNDSAQQSFSEPNNISSVHSTQQQIQNHTQQVNPDNLISSLSNLYPRQQHKSNFVPGIGSKVHTFDDPFSDVVREQNHQAWIQQQQQHQPFQQQQQFQKQPVQKQQFPMNTQNIPQQFPSQINPHGQVPIQPVNYSQASHQNQQQQLIQMQQQLLTLMQQQQNNPNQQTMAMMQQMMGMMQNLMINEQSHTQPTQMQSQQHQEMKKPNPQDNMFSDLFKTAATQNTSANAKTHDSNQMNQFSQMGSGSLMDMQENFNNPFNPFSTGGPSLQQQNTFNPF